MTFEQIKELIELVSGRGLRGLEIERSGFRLRIDGQALPAAPAAGVAPTSAMDQAAGQSAGPASPALSGTGGLAAAARLAGEGGAAAGGGATPGDVGRGGAVGAAGELDATALAERGGSAVGLHILNSPIVGTFYRAPSPSAPPFVDIGSRVRKGQILCIIEAMKLMNEIESDVDGVIAQIFPQNAQAVEFGEPLFAIRRS
ncbi:MAG TPA: acetyl-CoA carboxylase biotin carboxyl carrier protein [Thermoanaerobaculia bacterium]|nr:acetyl-CoA carboxylase biotin carboxyl carrier protein [Thermoanaerobaculia bacterium]